VILLGQDENVKKTHSAASSSIAISLTYSILLL
jgi:hypothetical protein